MKRWHVSREAVGNVARNKLRTALTMLGLVIGISSVIVLVGMSDGSNQEVADRIKALGGDVISVNIFDGEMAYDDIEAMRAFPELQRIAPSKYVNAAVSAGKKKSTRALVEASDEQYLGARNLKLGEGRNLSPVDSDNRSKVCLVGATVARDLFGTTDALGRTIKLAGHEFTVVGVLEEQGESMGLNTGTLVLVPFTAAFALGSDDKIVTAYARAIDENAVQAAKQAISDYLHDNLQMPSSKFAVNAQDELIDAGGSVSQTMSLLLGGIASISLLVAGIGVMNVMLVSVTERIREIGIKKALGAKRGDIMFQFLVEAFVLSLIGGVAGIALGAGLCMAADAVGIACVISPAIIVVAAGASMAIGLIFGMFPAYRASKLHPVEALRQD